MAHLSRPAGEWSIHIGSVLICSDCLVLSRKKGPLGLDFAHDAEQSMPQDGSGLQHLFEVAQARCHRFLRPSRVAVQLWNRGSPGTFQAICPHVEGTRGIWGQKCGRFPGSSWFPACNYSVIAIILYLFRYNPFPLILNAPAKYYYHLS